MTCYKNTVHGAWSSQQPQTWTHIPRKSAWKSLSHTLLPFTWPPQTLKGQKVGISSLSHPCSMCRFPSPKKPPEEGKKKAVFTQSVFQVTVPSELLRDELSLWTFTKGRGGECLLEYHWNTTSRFESSRLWFHQSLGSRCVLTQGFFYQIQREN